MPATLATYPDYHEAVQHLVKQHRKQRKAHLHLAVYLAPPKRVKRDIYLFEVIGDFAGGRIDPERKLFTFAYGSTPGLPLPQGVRLWMILTNPEELETAIRENWAGLVELREAHQSGKATVLYADSKGRKFWDQLR